MQRKRLVLHIDEVMHKALLEESMREMRLVNRHVLFLLRQDLLRRGLLVDTSVDPPNYASNEVSIRKA